MKKSLTYGFAIILAMIMVLGLTLPVLAKQEREQENNKPNTAASVILQRGAVTQVDAAKTFFNIKQGSKEIKINVDNNTKYYEVTIPRGLEGLLNKLPEVKERIQQELKDRKGPVLSQIVHLGQPATFDGLTVGDRVAVRVTGENNLATEVLIFKPAFENVKGVITDISVANKITISLANGAAVTLNYDSQTLFSIRGAIAVEEGQNAQALYRVKDMLAKTMSVNMPASTPNSTSSNTTNQQA